MVALLNFLPSIIVVTACLFLYWRYTKHKLTLNLFTAVIIGLVVVLTVLQNITPSYMPKGASPQMDNPAFEQSSAAMQDRLRKPELAPEQRQERFDEKFDAMTQIQK